VVIQVRDRFMLEAPAVAPRRSFKGPLRLVKSARMTVDKVARGHRQLGVVSGAHGDLGRTMDLTLYMHPLASFCHKVMLALYENDTPFEARMVDLADPAASADLRAHWAVGKIPVLRDHRRGQSVAETSIIIEYVAQHYPGAAQLIPAQPELALQARLWDRFYDLYVHAPMQKVVTDRLRPPGQHDGYGVEEALATLRTAYEMIERQLAAERWAIGEPFTISDCAAAPALFYAQTALPFPDDHPRLRAYFDRLSARPAFVRVLDGARPYFPNFPLHAAIPERFLHP
jgi:glutathione S-transferase